MNEVVPGPCPPEGCPPPTEIVCIETMKVYDFCFQTDTRSNLQFPIPSTCGAIPADALVDCSVGSVSCQETRRVPLENGGGLANVTLLLTVPLTFTVRTRTGEVICTFMDAFTFLKTVTLCAPEGTAIDCRVPSSSCDAAFVAGRNVHVSVTLCILIEANALVKLLVPSYGFCVPSECVTLPSPPVECPPENLFPPQCLPPT
ncbi:MAG: hypothetical protein IMW98_04545 [Firmicutes bacterium]|nr:hypothetical protein [Bacillota bacterium]